MASVIRTNEIGIVSFHHSVLSNDGEMVMTLGFQTNNTNGQEVADKCRGAWVDSLMARMASVVKLTRVNVLIQVGGNLESWDSFPQTDTFGGAGGGMLPTNVAVLIQKRTAFAGRKNRGRMFMGGIVGNDVTESADPNALAPAALTAWQTSANALFADLTDNSASDAINPVILHPLPNIQSTQIESFSVQARLATQRGRLR